MRLKLVIIAVIMLAAHGAGFGQTLEDADYLMRLGNHYYNQENYQQALECFLHASRIFDINLGKEHPDYANSLNSLGVLYHQVGDYARAQRYYLESLSIREKALGKEHPTYADSLNNMGALYWSMGDYTRAERYYLESLSIREKAFGKEHPDYANSLNNLGTLYRSIGDYVRAERYYLESLAIIEKALGKEHPDYASSLNGIGLLYGIMGDYAKAERYHLEALVIDEKIFGKEHFYYAVTLNNLGLLYTNMNDSAKAERYLFEALAIYEKTVGKETPHYATSLNNLGLLYNNMGDYARAERYHLEALAIDEKTLGKEHHDYALSLNNLGVIYNNMGDYAKAERYYLEALAIWEKILNKEHSYYAISLNNLGLLYNNMNDYSKAERYLLESLAIWEKTLGKEHPYYTASLDNLYILNLAARDYSRALPFKQEQYNLKADQVNRFFSFMSEQQRNAHWKVNSLSFESTYTLSWHHPIPESNILSYDSTLFTKGLLLRTANAVRDSIYASGNQALVAQFNELGNLHQQISALRQSGGNTAQIQTLEQQAEALDKSLTQSSAAFRDFQADLALNWQNVRDSLRQNEAAIEFVSFRIYDKGWTNKTQYAALILRPGMNAPLWIPLCEEIVLAKIFEQLNGKRVHEQPRILYDEQGAALYNAIWQPLEKALEGVTTVYYSPSGLLHKVAFNAIPAGEDKRLMDIYNLNLVSTTREVVYLRNRTAQAPNSTVVYGGLHYDTDAVSMVREAQVHTRSGAVQTRDLAIDYDIDTSINIWDYLQYTEIESRAIERLLNTNRVPITLYNGNRGNKESFKALSGTKTTVIHLATHGFFNQDVERNYEELERFRQTGQQSAFRQSDNPLRRSGLILSGANTWARNPVEGAQNGVLLAEEVAGLNLIGTELVVLSACETALGVVDNSEGVFGLQRAFKLAGAQTLIMSLWKVDDEATSILISAFYENWLAGKTKQDAFKEAQRKMRADSRYVSPFYWAAFVLMD